MPEAKTKTINGMAFEISQPYEEGQTITAIEARVLNQTRAENIGNNVRAKLKEMADAGSSEAELQAVVAELDGTYTFTAAGTRAAAKLDPYEKEANRLAREAIKLHLAQDGRKLTVAPEGYTDEEWEEKINSEVERIAATDDFVKEAKRLVDAKRKAGANLMSAMEGTSL